MNDSLAAGSSPTLRTGFIIRNQVVFFLASGLLFFPSFCFSASLQFWPGAMLALSCLGAAILLFKNPIPSGGLLAAPLKIKDLTICLALAALILLLGGETHLFYAVYDWRIRDAVLNDLSSGAGPTPYLVDGRDYILRAPLGMYMAPALIGRLFGVSSAHLAMWVQNSIFLGCIFYLFKQMSRNWANLAIMILFSGMSLLPRLIFSDHGHPWKWPPYDYPQLDQWNIYFEYSSSIVQFFWVPNHALPGWWLAALLLLNLRKEVDVASIGVSIAGGLFWSPLAIIPSVFWVLWLVISNLRQQLAQSRLWLGAIVSVGFMPIVIYLLAKTENIPTDLLIYKENFIDIYFIFIIINTLSSVFILFYREYIEKKLLYIAIYSMFLIAILPFFRFGPGNDLVDRASITSLVIISYVFGHIICEKRFYKTAGFFIGCVLVVITSPSALMQIAQALARSRYPISTCNLMDSSVAWSVVKEKYYAKRDNLDLKNISTNYTELLPTNYAAETSSLPKWLLAPATRPPLTPKTLKCWPDLDSEP